jgi:hypothetical protein
MSGECDCTARILVQIERRLPARRDGWRDSAILGREIGNAAKSQWA